MEPYGHVSPQSGDRLSRKSRLFIGKIAFDPLTMEEALFQVLALAQEGGAHYVVTPNVDHVVRAEKDADFVRICHNAALVVADGMPLVWASRFFCRSLPMRVAGSDLAPLVCKEGAKLGLRVFLLGGLPGEAEKAAANIRAMCPEFRLAGAYSPPFGFEHDQAECQKIIALLNDAQAHIILVGVGSPKQEKWIYQWRGEIEYGVLIGVGASIGFMAGTLRRAPRVLQRLGLEWAFRLCQEPRRLVGRYLRDLQFLTILWRSLAISRGHTVQNNV